MNLFDHFKKSDKILVIFIVLLIFMGGYQVGRSFAFYQGNPAISSGNQNLDQFFNFNPLSDVWSQIENEYIYSQDFDAKEASYGLAKGLVEALNDPYSEFLTPEETDSFNHDLNQELEGIGAEISEEDGVLKVVSPLKGSPAEKAGLKPGDILVEINQESTVDLNLYEAIQKIRGKKGSKVTLTIAREGEEQLLELTITRDIIELESLTGEMQDDIFYISINQFSDDTSKEFANMVNQVLLNSPKGLILDLRYNGGGYLQTAIDILGDFLPADSLAVIVESGADREREYLNTYGKNRLADIPLVVLINEGSASASEILAGALQDTDRATIIGETSYGKGTVQKIESFRDGSSLRLTVAKWLTPNENIIEKTGIKPDIAVTITDADYQNQVDTQLERAKQYLQNLSISKK